MQGAGGPRVPLGVAASVPASCRAGGLGAEERLPRNFCRPTPGSSLALQVGARVCTPCVCVCVHACVCVHTWTMCVCIMCALLYGAHVCTVCMCCVCTHVLLTSLASESGSSGNEGSPVRGESGNSLFRARGDPHKAPEPFWTDTVWSQAAFPLGRRHLPPHPSLFSSWFRKYP